MLSCPTLSLLITEDDVFLKFDDSAYQSNAPLLSRNSGRLSVFQGSRPTKFALAQLGSAMPSPLVSGQGSEPGLSPLRAWVIAYPISPSIACRNAATSDPERKYALCN
jgi:hypothetical protein